MGIILSKFRKVKTTYQILEKLEEDIKSIEVYSIDTQERQKRVVGNFLLISIGLYVISFIVFYFLFFPPTWKERTTYSIPLFCFPVLIILIKRIVAWYFQRKLNSNSNKLSSLRAEKRKIIEKVMDKETYKVAIDILNRFGDKANGFKSHSSSGALTPTLSPLSPKLNEKSLVVSKQSQSITPLKIQQSTYISPIVKSQLPITSANTPLNTSNRSFQSSSLPGLPLKQLTYTNNLVQHRQITPFPIINQNQKTVFDKMVDYLIGDGPSSRYGMICKECAGHNGMVSQEQYEYTSFRCAFCQILNPAKKLRPLAPKLPNEKINPNIQLQELSSSSSSSDEGNSEPESEIFISSQTIVAKTENDKITEKQESEKNVILQQQTETSKTEEIVDAKDLSQCDLENIGDATVEEKADTDKKND